MVPSFGSVEVLEGLDAGGAGVSAALSDVVALDEDFATDDLAEAYDDDDGGDFDEISDKVF